jgi:Tfp pilus assembly protein FimT
MRDARGVTLVELATVLAILTVIVGAVGVAAGRVLPRYRVVGAAGDLYAALHLTRARARETGVMHALVIDQGGQAFRIVENPTGPTARTVVGPIPLPGGAVARANTTIRFSPKGFAVPFGTITVQDGKETRRLVVNLLGRIRVEDRPPPR